MAGKFVEYPAKYPDAGYPTVPGYTVEVKVSGQSGHGQAGSHRHYCQHHNLFLEKIVTLLSEDNEACTMMRCVFDSAIVSEKHKNRIFAVLLYM